MNQFAARPIAVSEQDFDALVLKSGKPVLVDFWAECCGPCHAPAPVIESPASGFEGRATVATVDVDANQQIAARFGNRSIPTVILFDKGRIVETLVGVRPPGDYSTALEKIA